MRVPRIHFPGKLTPDQTVILSKDASQHVVQVLRLHPPARLILFNGDGFQYPAEMLSAEKKQVQCRITARDKVNLESPLQIHLGQAMGRGERMDYAVQKATELGVTAIYPLQTQFTNVHLPAERVPKRIQHWQNVAVAACEQCGRNRIPPVSEPLDLATFAGQAQGCRIVLAPGGQDRLEALDIEHTATLAIGPEGGFSDDELQYLQQQGFHLIQLGPRVLRTETAASAAMAALQALWGDFKS